MKPRTLLIIVVVSALVLVQIVLLTVGLFKSLNKVQARDYRNLTYQIEGKEVTLFNGYSEIQAAPGSASKIITKYFGNEATGDLDGDGTRDVVFLVTQEGGGSGVFYYALAALKTKQGTKGTNAVFLGDRIAPQSTQIRNNSIIINYAVRNPGEPMTTKPSVGVSRYLKVDDGLLFDIVSFRSSIDFTIGRKVVFDDGMTLSLTSIQDSRCKEGVVCVWAGEVSLRFAMNPPNSGTEKEIVLATTTAQGVTSDGYLFNLVEANEGYGKVVVNKSSSSAIGQCYVSGCSSQVCSDQKDVVTSCEYKTEYACYKNATCERQQNGQCGWTMTQVLTQCLNLSN